MPNRAWPAAIARNVREDLVEGHAGRDLGLPGRAGSDRRERGGMHRRVLPDLERGEVEPERPELPAQFRDFPPGGAAQALGDERVGDLGQLRVELLGRGVATGQRRRLADQERPRPAQPLGDEPEALAVRLVGEAPAELAGGLGQVLRVTCQARGEWPRHPVGRGRGGDRLHQPRRDGLVTAQDVVGLDAQRPLGDLGGHARVAVAVPADPAPEPQERPDARRARPRPAAVRGGTGCATRGRVERRIERPVEPRDDGEQRGVEEGHRRPHLVERGRADDAQVRGPPQQRDLLAQLAPELAVLGGGQTRVVGARQQDRAPAQGHQSRSAAGLGRVRCQDGRDLEPGDERVQLGVAPAQTAQPGDRVGDRVRQDPVACRALASTQRSDPPARLGQVDQPEIEREGADDGLRRAEVEAAQLLVEPLALDRIVGAAERDRPLPDPFHEREQLGTGLFRDDLAEQAPRAAGPRPPAGRGHRRSRSRGARRRPPA